MRRCLITPVSCGPQPLAPCRQPFNEIDAVRSSSRFHEQQAPPSADEAELLSSICASAGRAVRRGSAPEKPHVAQRRPCRRTRTARCRARGKPRIAAGRWSPLDRQASIATWPSATATSVSLPDPQHGRTPGGRPPADASLARRRARRASRWRPGRRRARTVLEEVSPACVSRRRWHGRRYRRGCRSCPTASTIRTSMRHADVRLRRMRMQSALSPHQRQAPITILLAVISA